MKLPKTGGLECISSLQQIDKHFFIDYGAADGGTAINFWSSILSKAKILFPASEFTLIGNDLPSNNNQALVNSLNHQYAATKMNLFGIS